MKRNETLEILMKTSPESLAETQHDAMKQHVLNVLADAMAAITKENYTAANKMTFNSPAGDCMGIDSYPIEFSYFTDPEKWGISFGDIVTELRTLKEQSEPTKK